MALQAAAVSCPAWLRHATTPKVPLTTKLALLDAYLAIMRARFEDRLRVELRIAENVGAALIPSLLLQPLVENAVHSALREPGVAACIEVTAARDGATLRLRVADNGPGAAGSGGGHGVGLANTRERLTLLHGEAHGFALQREGERTRASFRFR